MMEYIGKVKLNYTFYDGNDYYNDGDVIEEELLDIVKSGRIKETLYSSSKWPILYHLSDIRGNIIDWYPFEKEASVLEIGSGCGAVSGSICKKVKKVVGIELSKRRSMINAYRNSDCDNLEIIVGNFKQIEIDEKFDYVTLIGVLEYAANYIEGKSPYIDMLRKALQYVKPHGKIIIAIENKMGLKYLNGANEDHTGKLYVGINDYISDQNIRTFSRPELEQMFDEAGMRDRIFYYPQPDYKLPNVLYSELFLPHVGDIRFYHTNYDMDRMYSFDEGIAFDQICKDRMMSYFSNSFLAICGKSDYDVIFAKYSRERKKQYRIRTVVEKDKANNWIVKKEALNDEAQFHVNDMIERGKKIEGIYPAVKVLKGEIEGGSYKYPLLEGVGLDEIFFEYRNDVDKFVEEVKAAIQKYYVYEVPDEPFYITKEFIDIFGAEAPTDKNSIKYTNVDYVFHNIRVMNSQAFVFDYEWVFDFPIPHEFVIWRSIQQLYSKYKVYLKEKISVNDLLDQCGISNENNKIYLKMDGCFTNYVKGECDYINNYQKKAVSYKSQLDRYSVLMRLYDCWLNMKQKGKSIVDYLKANNIKTIAIYGFGLVGRRLYNDLCNTEIVVLYAIDKNAKKMKIPFDVDVKTLDGELDMVDAIIVTVALGYDEIRKQLQTKVNCQIYNLGNILLEHEEISTME